MEMCYLSSVWPHWTELWILRITLWRLWCLSSSRSDRRPLMICCVSQSSERWSSLDGRRPAAQTETEESSVEPDSAAADVFMRKYSSYSLFSLRSCLFHRRTVTCIVCWISSSSSWYKLDYVWTEWNIPVQDSTICCTLLCVIKMHFWIFFFCGFHVFFS